ncbi:hypothetical protein RM574_22395 [Streptomyces sp. DSM 41982]|uniref:Transmembrane protein n=1 Tax=Streptomyces evansiae TaxID=3075535 RepID=A0ABD5E9Y2_9ACTN|nr:MULTISPECIES: hypothetical protein [unclassified Streptomyces]MDT0418240.1 hypothetical protein [Streptomyces sp. DSM 41982]SCE33115.1 hypothetical protein GA0115246_1146117 [Streptomyces sp. SolWspMP-sol7th]
MHMNSAPHLLPEDHPEFERVLDEALRQAVPRPTAPDPDGQFPATRLKALALGSAGLIAATAAPEYRHYVRVREDLRIRASGDTEKAEVPVRAQEGGGLAAALGEVTEASGAGAVAVVAALTPVLAAVAAVVLLLIGYLLRLVDSEHVIGDALLTAGWIFAVLAAAAILVAGVALLLAALRNGATALPADPRRARTAEPDPEAEGVERARADWRRALLEKGFLPFFQEHFQNDAGLQEHGGEGPPGEEGPAQDGPVPSRSGGASRMPRLGYHRPGFSSPEADGEAASRPRYSSPDFSSPDFGGPEHRPE